MQPYLKADMYQTRTLPILKTSFTPFHFLLNSLVFHSLYLAFRAVKPSGRNASKVQANYDHERAKLLASLEAMDWESYALFPADYEDFIVINDRLRWGALREARLLLLERLTDTVRQKVKPGQTVIEFGSGDGRNLLYLQKQFPDIRFVGLELSPISVELSGKAAEKFGISGVEFYQANVCTPLPANVARPDIGLIYSSFALEQMPRIFVQALENMFALKPSAIMLFEPVSELWSLSLRSLVARLRVRGIDRLVGLPAQLKNLLNAHPDYALTSIKRSGIALNPHTEMCEVLIEKTSS